MDTTKFESVAKENWEGGRAIVGTVPSAVEPGPMPCGWLTAVPGRASSCALMFWPIATALTGLRFLSGPGASGTVQITPRAT
jgi:hypothetical protein